MNPIFTSRRSIALDVADSHMHDRLIEPRRLGRMIYPKEQTSAMMVASSKIEIIYAVFQ